MASEDKVAKRIRSYREKLGMSVREAVLRTRLES